MPIVPSRPRSGRLLDVLMVALCAFVFLGLGFYHYRRLDREQIDSDRVKELAGRILDTPKSTASSDWAHWRGPNYDGVSTESQLLTTWPKMGPTRLWEATVGEGFASVAVSAGKVFSIFQDGANESVVCWDAETGKEIWRFRYACDYKNYYGNGPRATPTVAGDLVFTVGATGLLHCLKTVPATPNGEVVWKKDLQADFGGIVPKWGVSFSALVQEKRVFVVPGGPGGNALAALDTQTGAVLWKTQDDTAGYTSPIPAKLHGQHQILFFTGKRLVSVHSESGEVLWEFPWQTENDCNIASPLVVQDYVFISSYYGRGCALLKIDKSASGWETSVVYKNKRMRNHIGTSVRIDDHLFGFDDKLLKCMNFRTGEILWEQEGFDKGSLAAFGKNLVVYGANGQLALVEANPKGYVENGRLAFSNQGHSCWSVPVIADGRLYVRDQERLVCFDIRSK